jgi:predicted metal-dependent phosphoesterase TrpH
VHRLVLDLHNHTSRSYDASNTLADYERAHAAGAFDVIAITDHNSIAGALELANEATFPVIVGEEIDTRDGELIGLFLPEPAPIHLPAVETARWIRARGGLVYLQHPGYRFLRPKDRLDAPTIADLTAGGLVDVVEVANGGAFMGHANRRGAAIVAACGPGSGVVAGAGSDAHHPGDIGSCAVVVSGAEPFGPVTPGSLKDWLARGVVLDRRRPAAASLGTRGRYAARGLGRRLRGEPGRPRLPR